MTGQPYLVIFLAGLPGLAVRERGHIAFYIRPCIVGGKHEATMVFPGSKGKITDPFSHSLSASKSNAVKNGRFSVRIQNDLMSDDKRHGVFAGSVIIGFQILEPIAVFHQSEALRLIVGSHHQIGRTINQYVAEYRTGIPELKIQRFLLFADKPVIPTGKNEDVFQRLFYENTVFGQDAAGGVVSFSALQGRRQDRIAELIIRQRFQLVKRIAPESRASLLRQKLQRHVAIFRDILHLPEQVDPVFIRNIGFESFSGHTVDQRQLNLVSRFIRIFKDLLFQNIALNAFNCGIVVVAEASHYLQFVGDGQGSLNRFAVRITI